MKMYIIRHGQTPWNARKCLQGRSDVDLNENGIYLAELTGKALRDVTFDMAFTSPLSWHCASGYASVYRNRSG